MARRQLDRSLPRSVVPSLARRHSCTWYAFTDKVVLGTGFRILITLRTISIRSNNIMVVMVQLQRASLSARVVRLSLGRRG